MKLALLPQARADLHDAGKLVLWGLLLYLAVDFVGDELARNAMGMVAGQAVVAELGAGRLAVAWTDPHGPLPTAGSIARRALKGAALGLGAAVLVVSFATVTSAAKLAPNRPVAADAVLGLVTAGFVAMRDELLLRGVVLRAFRNVASPLVLVAICGAAGAAARYGAVTAALATDPSATAQALVAGLGAVAFAALWLSDRGAWLPWGAHAGWQWATGAALHGGVLDVRWARTPWGGGEAGFEASLAVACALGVVALAAATTLGRFARHAPARS